MSHWKGNSVNYKLCLSLLPHRTWNTARSASYLDIHLEIHNLFQKRNFTRDDINFPIVNFPFIWSNIPAEPAWSIYLLVDMIFQSLWHPPVYQYRVAFTKEATEPRIPRGATDDQWSSICSIYRSQILSSFHLSSVITGLTRVTCWVPLVEQEHTTIME
jgi:hypothetical protein